MGTTSNPITWKPVEVAIKETLNFSEDQLMHVMQI